MWIAEIISLLYICSLTYSFVIQQPDTDTQSDGLWNNGPTTTLSSPTSTNDWNQPADNITVDDVNMGPNTTENPLSEMLENSTLLRSRVPEGALLLGKGETSENIRGHIGHELKLTDMSKIQSSSNVARTHAQHTTTTLPLMATPPPEVLETTTATLSETEIRFRKFAEEILMKLFEKFVLKAAAAKSPAEFVRKGKTAVRTGSPQTAVGAVATVVQQRPSSLRRRLFYGGLSEYEGAEESGFYRREIEREFNGSF